MVNLAEKDDESYGNFGNKRVTQKDFENFSQSLRNNTADRGKTYIPGSIGEKLRRETTGEIGSQHYKGNIEDLDDIEKIMEEVNRHGNDLRELIVKQLLKKNDDSLDELPDDLTSILRQLPYLGVTLNRVTERHKNNGMPSVNEIKTARRALSLGISSLNKLYYQYFGGDRRLHTPIMNLISLINTGINFLDNDYEKARENELPNDLRGNLQKEMEKENIISINGQKVSISPTYYEAYIQVFGSPREALNAYMRYAQFDKMDKEGYKWSSHPTDEKDFQRAKRLHGIAEEFVQSHRYMLEKDNYDEHDVEYAFMQYNREFQNGIYGEMLKPESVTAGNAYITMVMNKVFGGIREDLKSYVDRELGNESQPQDATLFQWLDNEMCDSLSSNKDQMLVILRGLRNSLKTSKQPKVKQDDMFEKFRDAMDIWITRIFSQGKKEINPYIEERIEVYFMNIIDKSSNYKTARNKVNELIAQVLKEDNEQGNNLIIV